MCPTFPIERERERGYILKTVGVCIFSRLYKESADFFHKMPQTHLHEFSNCFSITLLLAKD